MRRPSAKSARMKRVAHGDLGGQLGEVLLGDRVAVDRDQRARGADPLGDQARVAAGAEGAVDRDLARLRVQRLDQLPGEDGDVRAVACQAGWPRDAVRSVPAGREVGS